MRLLSFLAAAALGLIACSSDVPGDEFFAVHPEGGIPEAGREPGAAACDLAKCPAPTNACQDAVCAPDGSCGFATKPNGKPAATEVPGDCKKTTCVDGTVTQQTDDTDLPDDKNECTSDACSTGVPSHAPKALNAVCGVGGASFCDGSGTCKACTTAAQCPGVDSECKVRTCNVGVCGFALTPSGFAVAAQTVGDCKRNECDGAGGVVSVTFDADVEDDGLECTTDTCNAGTKVHTPLAIGTACLGAAGLKCNATGQCVGCNAPSDCAVPGNACLQATCSNAGVCGTKDKANGTNCSDNNACSQTDTCQAGACTGANPVVCTAQDQCHGVGTCSAATGTCSNPAVANGSACSDASACTQSDTCQAGSCTGANPVVCAAADQCHDAGSCNPATGACSNPPKGDGTVCSDGNACTQTDTCLLGTCSGQNPVACAASDQCHAVGTCNAGTGVCSNPAKANGSACSDGNACTQTDTCQAGVCSGANPVVCAASDQCHAVGTCNVGTGACSNPAKANGSVCSDGDACTQTDTCQAGACSGTNPVMCAASDQCHAIGTCNAATGVCSNPSSADGTACNDGNACTQTDTCQAGACSGANPVVCLVPLVCAPADGVCN